MPDLVGIRRDFPEPQVYEPQPEAVVLHGWRPARRNLIRRLLQVVVIVGLLSIHPEDHEIKNPQERSDHILGESHCDCRLVVCRAVG